MEDDYDFPAAGGYDPMGMMGMGMGMGGLGLGGAMGMGMGGYGLGGPMGMGGYGLGGEDDDEAMKDLHAGAGAGAEAGDDPPAPAELKVGEEREIGKEGLKKKLVKEGEGWDRPGAGDEVEGEILRFASLACVSDSEFWGDETVGWIGKRLLTGLILMAQFTTRGR